MSTISSEAPSSRALRLLNNRNNVADLYLRKRLEQMEKEKNFYMNYLDKDRLDVTYFLKNLHKCDSDDLPQSRLIKEEWDSDDDLSDDDFLVRPLRSRNAHTAKTAPPRVGRGGGGRRGRHHDDENDDDDDVDSLDEHHPRRSVKTSVPSRREMLSRRHHEEELAKESKYEKTEDFLRMLRQNAAREYKDALTYQLTRREFTAFLLSKLRGEAAGVSNYPGAGGRSGAFWTGPGQDDGWRGDDFDEETWARSRKDMVYPIKRLGNIASKFYESGRNSPAHLAGVGQKRRSSSKKRGGQGAAAAGGGGGDPRAEPTAGDNVQPKLSELFPKQRSVFEITDADPPASSLPRPAGLPDFTRCRRDTVMDTARAYGFGEAAIVPVAGKSSPPPQTSTPATGAAPPVSLFSKANIAEMRRAERQVKANKAPPWNSRQNPVKDNAPQGTDMLRAILQMKCRFRAKPLDDRVRDFMKEIDDLTKSRGGSSHLPDAKK